MEKDTKNLWTRASVSDKEQAPFLMGGMQDEKEEQKDNRIADGGASYHVAGWRVRIRLRK